MNSAPGEREERPGGRSSDLTVSPPAVTELLAGLIFIAIAAVGMVSLLRNRFLELGRMGTDPGPGFVPWIALWAMALGGLGYSLWVIFAARRSGGLEATDDFAPHRLWLPLLLLLSMILYQQSLVPLGFFWASLIFSLVWVPIIHWRWGGSFKRRHFVQIPLEAALVTWAIYALFRYGILVPLP